MPVVTVSSDAGDLVLSGELHALARVAVPLPGEKEGWQVPRRQEIDQRTSDQAQHKKNAPGLLARFSEHSAREDAADPRDPAIHKHQQNSREPDKGPAHRRAKRCEVFHVGVFPFKQFTLM